MVRIDSELPGNGDSVHNAILLHRFQSVMVTQNWITTIVLLVDLRLKVSESTLKATGKP
jgi:hypothetical protein